jgi:hypothetical protein
VKLQTTLKQPAPRDSTRFVSRYLDEIIDYGGTFCTRAEAILDMQGKGIEQQYIDRWLQGNEMAARIRRRREKFSLSLCVPEA